MTERERERKSERAGEDKHSLDIEETSKTAEKGKNYMTNNMPLNVSVTV